jgi:hypothetical protein
MLCALVITIRRKQFQVLWTVIRRVVIPMVNNLTLIKQSPNHLLHHQPVLAHVAVPVSAGMIGPQN